MAQKGSPRRESNVRSSFRKKVEFLEQLARQGVPSGVWIPQTLREVVEWTDGDKGFGSWSSYSVAVLNGPNGDLRRRLDLALRTLNARGDPPKKSRRGREVTHAHALAEVKILAAQNLQLIDEKYALAAEIRRLKHSLDIVERREAQLVDQLNKILPIERQLRNIRPG